MKQKLDTYRLKGKKRLRVYQFTLPLYKVHYYIYIGKTVREAAQYADTDFPGTNIEDTIDADTGAQVITVYHKDHGSETLMLLEPMDNPEYALATLAHESLHISWRMCEKLGIHLEADNHEAQAYIMHEIFTSSVAAYRDYVKRYKLNNKL